MTYEKFCDTNKSRISVYINLSYFLLFSDWNNFHHISIQSWEKLYLDWLSNGENIVVVFYEDLLKEDNLIPTIESMVRFMSFTVDKL